MVSVDITFWVHFPSRSSDQPSFTCQMVSGAKSAAVDVLVRAPKLVSLAITAVLGNVYYVNSAVKMKIRYCNISLHGKSYAISSVEEKIKNLLYSSNDMDSNLVGPTLCVSLLIHPHSL